MRTDRELLQDAVDAIEAVLCTECAEPWGLIEEIRDRLAEPKPEPAAWMNIDGNVSDNNDCNCFPIPLYRHPPRHPVRLSDEEIRDVMLSNGFTIKEGYADLKPYVFQAVRAIEQAILEKNN